MKSTLLNHKGYHGSIEPSVRDGKLKGQILFIDDTIGYTADTIPRLQQAFERCVDGYLADCARTGKFPQRPFKGQFNVRVAPQLHQTAVLRAEAEGTSLNNVVVRALKSYLKDQLALNDGESPTHTDQSDNQSAGQSVDQSANEDQENEREAA